MRLAMTTLKNAQCKHVKPKQAEILIACVSWRSFRQTESCVTFCRLSQAAEHRKLQGSPTLPTEALASGASGRLRPQLRQTAAPAAPLRLPRARRSRTLSSPARPAARASGGAAGSAPIPDANSLKQIIQAVFRDPWDTPPRPWRTFWATKLAATVVSSDETAGQVEVVPVETSGLRFPNDQSDALHRLRTNAVLYRQNYALIALGALALGTLRARTGPWHLAVLAAFVAYALCSSDRLLSEAQLASNGRLVWNAKRAAGLDRALVIRVAPVVAFLAVAACPLVRRGGSSLTLTPRMKRAVQARALQLITTAPLWHPYFPPPASLLPQATIQWVLSSGVLAALLVLSHAVLRPVDLESTFAQIWGDITSAKSRHARACHSFCAATGVRWGALPLLLRCEEGVRCVSTRAGGCLVSALRSVLRWRRAVRLTMLPLLFMPQRRRCVRHQVGRRRPVALVDKFQV